MASKRRQQDIIVGLDIGSTAIRVAVGQCTADTRSPLQIIAAVETPSEGIHRGDIVSIDETVSSISQSVEKAERLMGVPIEHVWVGITGTYIASQENRGVVAVAKSDGEIASDDVQRAMDAARMIAPPLNHDVLHVLPRRFTVDGQTGIKDPVGMTGARLEVDARIMYGLSSHIKNITKVVYRTGVDIDDVVLSILATGDVVTTNRQKEVGVAVVDIGGSTTSIIVYEDGDVLHTSVLPVGSEHITNDIAIGLRTLIDTAEFAKLEYGNCIPACISKKEMIDPATIGAEGEDIISLRYLSEIIEARVSEMLEKIQKEIASVGKAGLLPAGVIFTGGGSKIGGLIDLAKEVLHLPASIGYPLNVHGMSDSIRDIAFSGSIGLVQWGSQVNTVRSKNRGKSRFTSSSKVLNKLQNVWKTLIP